MKLLLGRGEGNQRFRREERSTANTSRDFDTRMLGAKRDIYALNSGEYLVSGSNFSRSLLSLLGSYGRCHDNRATPSFLA